ncbi:MAG: GNAT family N-acetyltransferase [Chloroflexi bacterium]|nr:GNAT family N-acetyltransferase [Chloroflexota bacterium]
MLLPVPGHTVRPLQAADRAEHLRMRIGLWPDEDATDLAQSIDQLLGDPNQVAFVAERQGGGLCGMVEAGIRPFANGVDESPCAFVEGWWVDADVRRSGVGRSLVEAVEDWARGRGFHELGSDALLENTLSHTAHRALGFEERERTVNFRKFL